MLSKILIAAVSGAALANAQAVAQGYAPSPVLLTHTMSGVLPVLPATPFPGVETIEGAITYDGPMNPGFTGQLGDAVVQTGNTAVTYRATLPSQQFDPYVGSTITGSISIVGSSNGTGVMVMANFTGLPSEAAYGPFVYHIHNLPISADGNCTTSLGHLDPTNRGEYYPCNPSAPQTCQAGDLAGKHGNITTMSFSAVYNEPYLSTVPGSPYFFGDKSIVIHATNTTRLTCANFSMVAAAPASSTMTTTAPVATYTGAAAEIVAAGGVLVGLGSLVAFFL